MTALRRANPTAWIVAVVTVLVVSSGAVSLASEDPANMTAFTRDLDQQILRGMGTYDIPGVVVALIDDGVMVWSQAYGYADVGAGRPMTVDAVSRTESISKSVTAWGVMKLVEQGRLGLDDSVVEYFDDWIFPEAAYPPESITVRQLLSHTAGVASGSVGVHYPPDGDVPSLEDNLSSEARLVQPSGSSFVYSNVGFNLLELLIEEVTGQDFAEYMEHEILAPLGMQNSSFAWDTEFAAAIPTGYDLSGNPVPAYVYPEKASGGLYSTVEDISRFVSAGMTSQEPAGERVLGQDSIRQLYEPAVEIPGLFGFVADSYGFGHFIETLAKGERAVWHGGQGHGWMTHFHSLPESGDGIVILTNSQRSWPLIARILEDWSDWNGVSPVGMSIISKATTGLWGIIALAWVWAVWQMWRVGDGMYRGNRRVAPLSDQARFGCVVQAALAVALASSLVWAVNQDYLFVSSIFPQAARWLGWTMAGVAVVLVISALTPRIAERIAEPVGDR